MNLLEINKNLKNTYNKLDAVLRDQQKWIDQCSVAIDNKEQCDFDFAMRHIQIRNRLINELFLYKNNLKELLKNYSEITHVETIEKQEQ